MSTRAANVGSLAGVTVQQQTAGGMMNRGKKKADEPEKDDSKYQRFKDKSDEEKKMTIIRWFSSVDDKEDTVNMSLIDNEIKITLSTGMATKYLSESSKWSTVQRSAALFGFSIKVYGFKNTYSGKKHCKNLGHYFAHRIQDNPANSWIYYQKGGYLTNCTNSGDSHFSLDGTIAPTTSVDWPEGMEIDDVPLKIMKAILGDDGALDGAVIFLPTTDATWTVAAPPIGGGSGAWVLTFQGLHNKDGA